jgi:hypothetical protein
MPHACAGLLISISLERACGERTLQDSGNGCVLRTFAGLERGNVDTEHPTLEAAIRAFEAAAENSIPRVIRDGETLITLDLEAGLAPLFRDAEVERIYEDLASRQPPLANP